MILRNALYAVRLQQAAFKARLLNETALLEAITSKVEFTILGFQENGTILACIGNQWVEV